jgi:hypothetical protein
MTNPDRKTILETLNTHWSGYVRAFQALSAAEQSAFLDQQGYKRLADLLAHVTAWWKNGISSIETYRVDPAYRAPNVDVDAFNAAAVESVKDLSEAEVIRAFEEMRLKFVELVNSLTDLDFADKRITKQLNMELIGHYTEHQIK